MAEIKPFRGILYNPEILSGKKPVFAPPYDVISPELQKELHRENHHNVVRLILGRMYPDDNARDNRYTRAAGFLREWLNKCILVIDNQPAIYLYAQKFSYGGKIKERLGFIGLLKLAGLRRGPIFPHEETKPGPKEDQTKLMEATHANLSPIFTLFSDKDGNVRRILKKVVKEAPLLKTKDRDGVMHRLWRLTDHAEISCLKKKFKIKELYIADGHHRYESALALMRLLLKNASFTLTYFTPMEDDGLLILPTHRVVKSLSPLPVRERIKVRGNLSWKIKSFSRPSGLLNALNHPSNRTAVGIYHGGGRKYYLIKVSRKELKALQVHSGKPKCWVTLPTSILHHIIIPGLYGREYKELELSYTQDSNEAVRMVERDTRGTTCAFLLRPIRMSEFKSVVKSGVKMPPKTTFFYPKVLSGLVFYKFNT